MPIQRLIRLSDIVFAVAMIVLALVFDPIPLHEISPENLTKLLIKELPDFGIYVITFLTIAYYWFTHVNQFKHYQETDAIHTFLSLFSLLFVVVLPYASDLSEAYNNVFAVNVFYSLSATGVGIFSTAAWIYGTQNRRLVASDLSDETIRHVRQEGYFEPIIYLLAIGANWLVSWGWSLTVALGFLSILLIQAKSPRS